MTPNQWQQLQRRLSVAAVKELSALWRSLEYSPDFGALWDGVEAATIVSRAQIRAAERADEYVGDQIGRTRPPERPVQPASLAGVASDGRPLATLLRLPAASTIRALNAGTPPGQAFALGRRRLGLLGATQVFDAGRGAASVAMAAEPKVKGYYRAIRGKTTCGRCLILAGKFFRWDAGFQRHPRCDCEHVPTTEANPSSGFGAYGQEDLREYFNGLTRQQQEQAFTKAGARAIRDGADIEQVVNARRGMKTVTAYGRKISTTTEGITTRAWFGKQNLRAGNVRKVKGDRYRSAVSLRITPEQIYKDARNREDAIRLLSVHGYI